MTDNYYYDDDFEYYKASTRDAGPWLLIGVCAYSTLCLVLLPISLSLWKKWERRRAQYSKTTNEPAKDFENMIEEPDCSLQVDVQMVECEVNKNDEVSFESAPPSPPRAISPTKQKHAKGGKYTNIPDMDIECNNQSTDDDDDTASDDDMFSFESLANVLSYDEETKQQIMLGSPFIFSGISGALFSTLTMVVISRYCHYHALSAYVISNLIIELSLLLIGGIPDATSTLASHAIGAGNYKMAGSYSQISTVLYVTMSIPFLGACWFWMETGLQLFGLDEITVEIGTKYTKVAIFHHLIEGMYDALFVLLDINGYEKETTLYGTVYGAIELGLVWGLLATVKGFDLFWVGVTHLCVDLVLNGIFLSSAIWLGWFDAFWEGLVKTCALSNKSAVWTVLSTAIPLSIGSFLEYGEVLTMFAAALGPAEVAAWGLMESIWELFEAATEGFAEAGSIRLAKHLGKGDIQTSKQSCGKSLFINTCLATTITAIFYLFRDSIATWLTDDETLQSIINSMIPLIGVGNVFMAFGTTSWALIGAQGRFKTSTMISGAVSCLVTVPLAGLFCMHWGLGLDGLVASIVIGYTTVSFWMSLVLLMSDWDGISLRIIEENEEEEDEEDMTDSESESEDELSSSLSSLEFDDYGIVY